MTLALQESAWPERLGSGGAAGAVTRREHGFDGKLPEGASWRERHRVPGSKAGPGKQTVSHRWVMLPGTEYHLPSLLFTRNWPAAPDLGSIRGGGWVQPGLQEKQGCWRCREPEDEGGVWGGRCRVPGDRGHLGQADRVPGPCEVIMGRVWPCKLSPCGNSRGCWRGGGRSH